MGNRVSKGDEKRVLLLSFFLFFCFSCLIIQFYSIQVIQGEKWVKEADRQHYFYVREPFSRGTFYSNTEIKEGHPPNLQPFAIDVQKFHIYVDPRSIPEKHRKSITETLSYLLKDVEEGFIKQQLERKSRSRKIKRWLTRSDKEKILKWWYPFARQHRIARNAIYFLKDYQRSYPFNSLLGQVLHTVQDLKDEKTQRSFPTGGLELRFNDFLRGKQGKRRMMRSPRNALELGKVLELPKHGADVYLTVNHYIQSIAEEEVAKGVEKTGAKSGWAVMMEPYTGEILALAQYPSFDLKHYTECFNDPDRIEETKVKSITNSYEPGSVSKPITMAIALLANKELIKRGELPLFDPKEKMDVSNKYLPGRSKVITDTSKAKYLNFLMAMQKSSNIYPAMLAQRIVKRLGADWYRKHLVETFALDRKSGIELPGESLALIPTPGKLYANGRMEWSAPTPYSLAMGYNLQTNNLQLIRAWAIFANGGYLVNPTFIKKIVRGDHLLYQSEFKREQVLPKDVVDTIVYALRFVTKPGGTARRANILGYTEVGKTGTSRKLDETGQYTQKKHFNSFIGFTPVAHPRFVLFVGMDEPEVRWVPGVGRNHHGGVSCAPVFQKIARRTLVYLGVEPDDAQKGKALDGKEADWTEKTRKLNKKYKEWNG